MRLYLDTNIISMWYDQKPHNWEKKRDTRRFLLLCKRGYHEGYVSEIARGELLESKEPYASRDLGLVLRLGLGRPAYDAAQYLNLFAKYDSEPMFARIPRPDLRHMAIYCVSELEALVTQALVTYDLKDFGNQVRLDLFRKINHAQGITKELRIGPPEAFLPPAPSV